MSEASKHIAALDRKIRDTFTPGVTTGYDADYDDSLLVVGKRSTAVVVSIIVA